MKFMSSSILIHTITAMVAERQQGCRYDFENKAVFFFSMKIYTIFWIEPLYSVLLFQTKPEELFNIAHVKARNADKSAVHTVDI